MKVIVCVHSQWQMRVNKRNLSMISFMYDWWIPQSRRVTCDSSLSGDLRNSVLFCYYFRNGDLKTHNLKSSWVSLYQNCSCDCKVNSVIRLWIRNYINGMLTNPNTGHPTNASLDESAISPLLYIIYIYTLAFFTVTTKYLSAFYLTYYIHPWFITNFPNWGVSIKSQKNIKVEELESYIDWI